jgi:hypothetical protein
MGGVEEAKENERTGQGAIGTARGVQVLELKKFHLPRTAAPSAQMMRRAPCATLLAVWRASRRAPLHDSAALGDQAFGPVNCAQGGGGANTPKTVNHPRKMKFLQSNCSLFG